MFFFMYVWLKRWKSRTIEMNIYFIWLKRKQMKRKKIDNLW